MLENEKTKKTDAGIGTFAFRVLKICLILSGVSVFASILMGSSTLDVRQETENNKSFIKVAKEMSPNFEESLSLYTGNTQKIVDYLLTLRPSTEEGFITFISDIEDLGQELSLNLNVKSMEAEAVKPGKKAAAQDNSTISYQIGFYGSIRDMKSFIKKLDELPYYIEVSNITYSNPAFADEEAPGSQNISLTIKLFTKN
jgi:hypothetical protein